MSPSDKKLKATKKALVVCGPTASGKSELSDALAEGLTEAHGDWVPTLVVDAMQVYREIPTITNQARRRPAELVGIVSVTEEWTVARHKARAEEIIWGIDTPFVLDAGTGMYLNAIILDVPLAPKVDAKTRQLAQGITLDAPNPRRAARAKELELAGAPPRGSIWDGGLRYETALIYLRPDRETLDAAIAQRSVRILSGGLEEAAKIKQMEEAEAGINLSVADSIGVRELIEHLRGEITLEEAQTRITTRTRKLARRQMRWFDKLARTLEGQIFTEIVKCPPLNSMHDRIWA
jgi:tRNA dimethylallyltransferase